MKLNGNLKDYVWKMLLLLLLVPIDIIKPAAVSSLSIV